jgi:hypothetical protein
MTSQRHSYDPQPGSPEPLETLCSNGTTDRMHTTDQKNNLSRVWISLPPDGPISFRGCSSTAGVFSFFAIHTRRFRHFLRCFTCAGDIGSVLYHGRRRAQTIAGKGGNMLARWLPMTRKCMEEMLVLLVCINAKSCRSLPEESGRGSARGSEAD